MHDAGRTRGRLLAVAALAVGALVGCAPETDNLYVPIDTKEATEIRGNLVAASATADEAGGASQQRTGWATLKGRFVVEGTPPAPVRLSVNKDAGICAPAGQGAPFSKAVVVDSATGGLGNVVVFARDVSDENCHESAAPGNKDEIEFDQEVCVFLSHVQVMQVSQKLKVLNSDQVGHNTKIEPAKGRGINELIPALGHIFYQPTAVESNPSPVSCSIHPWMKAYVLPLENSYGVTTAVDGSFTIENLPAGVEIEFQVWHETLSDFGAAKIEGVPGNWKRGRFTFKLDPDKTHELTATIPSSAF